VRSEEADDLMAGIELLDMVTVAPLGGAEQAARLAAVMAITDQIIEIADPGD
jgi:hypothetical protein